jgi:hypothetical protein
VYASVLQDPEFFRLLVRIDEEFAAETRRAGCPRCSGPLHVSDYPRKPRGCPAAVLEEYSWRLSFTCGRCEQRATSSTVSRVNQDERLASIKMRRDHAAPGSCCS